MLPKNSDHCPVMVAALIPDNSGESEAEISRRRSRIWLMVRVALGLALLGYLLVSIDLGSLVARLTSIRLLPCIALGVVATAKSFLMAYKWNLLLRARGILISIWEAARLYYVGYLVGSFTPGGIGAEGYRVVSLSRLGKTELVLATLVLERFIGLAVISTFAALALPFSARYLGASANEVSWTIALGSAVVVLSLFVSLRPAMVEGLASRFPYLRESRIARPLRSFYRSYSEFRNYRLVLSAFTVLTLLELITLVFFNWLAARSLGIAVSFPYFLCAMPLLHIIQRLPISFQQIGVQEGLFAYFLMAVGFSAADGVAVALLLRISDLVLMYFPAILLLWIGPGRTQPR